MKASVTDKKGLTLANAPRITLEMSVEEFAALEHLRWRGLRGHGDLRERIDAAFHEALESLPDYWQGKINRAAHTFDHAQSVQEISKSIRSRR